MRALTTPERIQEFVIGLSANFEEEGDTLRSVRGVLRHRRAHCIEAAFTAACALWLQGEPPLLMDLAPRAIRTMSSPSSGATVAGAPSPRATMSGCAGATRSIGSPRELAMSYFHEYTNKHRKTLRTYSQCRSICGSSPSRSG